MSKLLNQILNDYDENDTVINARNARIMAVFRKRKGFCRGNISWRRCGTVAFPSARADHRKKHRCSKRTERYGFQLYGATYHQGRDGFYSHQKPGCKHNRMYSRFAEHSLRNIRSCICRLDNPQKKRKGGIG